MAFNRVLSVILVKLIFLYDFSEAFQVYKQKCLNWSHTFLHMYHVKIHSGNLVYPVLPSSANMSVLVFSVAKGFLFVTPLSKPVSSISSVRN